MACDDSRCRVKCARGEELPLNARAALDGERLAWRRMLTRGNRCSTWVLTNINAACGDESDYTATGHHREVMLLMAVKMAEMRAVYGAASKCRRRRPSRASQWRTYQRARARKRARAVAHAATSARRAVRV